MLCNLADGLLQFILRFLDERALGAATCSKRHLVTPLGEVNVWRHLALKRDPRAELTGGPLGGDGGCRLFARSPEACAAGGSGGRGSGPRLSWREVCRRLHPRVASLAWPSSTQEAPAATDGVWEELMDSGGVEGGGELEAALEGADVGRGGLWSGQSPHLFRLGPGRLLGVAGGYYAENLGGAEVRPLHDVLLIELEEPGTDGGPRVTPLIEGLTATAREAMAAAATAGREVGPRGHPLLHGAASDLDERGCRAIFFGGGSPHGQLTNASTALVLQPAVADPDADAAEAVAGGGAAIQATWEPISTAGERPSPRQGARGVVFEDRLVIFGGRGQGGGCLNDVWELPLAPGAEGHCMWRSVECEGQAPSPRVWYTACHAVYGRWFVIGGSEWQFEVPQQPHDYNTLYVLELEARRWSTLAPPGPPPQLPGAVAEPGEELPSAPWVVAAALLPLGGRQMMMLGGSMPHLLGPEGLSNVSLRRWRSWYARLDRPLVFDHKTSAWSTRQALLGETIGLEHGANTEQRVSEVLLRSHMAAVYMPDRHSAIVFGGSRYFTGDYFHDLLELRLPPPTTGPPEADEDVDMEGESDRPPWPPEGAELGEEELPVGLPSLMLRAVQGRSRLTRGLRGRLRSMVRDGVLDLFQYRRIMATF